MAWGMERDLIPVITRLSNQAKSIDEAVELLQAVLAGEIGGALVLLEPFDAGSPRVAKATSDFMESRRFPFRGLYTAPLVVGKVQVGKLIACFGSFGVPGKELPTLTTHVAEQLSAVLARTCRNRYTAAVSFATPLAVLQPEAA